MGLLEKALKYKRKINKKGQETLIDKIEGPAETEFLEKEENDAYSSRAIDNVIVEGEPDVKAPVDEQVVTEKSEMDEISRESVFDNVDEIGDDRFKASFDYEKNTWSLFNVSDDIGEEEDLAGVNKKVLSTLAKKLDTWLTQDSPTWQPKYPRRKKSGLPAGRPPQP